MPRYLPESQHVHGDPVKTGILLVNLGTPDEPTPSALRRYLAEFLSDPRVIEIPRWIWLPLLHGVILNTRPRQSAEKYARIWTNEGSPLRVHTQAQAAALRRHLGERIQSPLVIEHAMRYGKPSIASAVDRLKADGCDRILLFPMYPQYAAATTASAQDALFEALRRYRSTPAVRTIRHFHDHPAYIGALARAVREYWQEHGRPDKLAVSFHGVPRFTLDKGDPYHCECQKTGRLLASELGLAQEQYVVSFQSRFGRAQWVTPYTSPTLESLGKRGCSRVDVVCPGFTADCLETLEEIAIEGKATFIAAGGREFHYIACLNERDDWIRALGEIALENLQGWASPVWDDKAAARQAEDTKARALALGATR